MFKFKVNGEDEIEAVTQRCSINKISEKFHKIHRKCTDTGVSFFNKVADRQSAFSLKSDFDTRFFL